MVEACCGTECDVMVLQSSLAVVVFFLFFCIGVGRFLDSVLGVEPSTKYSGSIES